MTRSMELRPVSEDLPECPIALCPAREPYAWYCGGCSGLYTPGVTWTDAAEARGLLLLRSRGLTVGVCVYVWQEMKEAHDEFRVKAQEFREYQRALQRYERRMQNIEYQRALQRYERRMQNIELVQLTVSGYLVWHVTCGSDGTSTRTAARSRRSARHR
eukprot:2995673-Rhodomonas_salina.2